MNGYDACTNIIKLYENYHKLKNGIKVPLIQKVKKSKKALVKRRASSIEKLGSDLVDLKKEHPDIKN